MPILSAKGLSPKPQQVAAQLNGKPAQTPALTLQQRADKMVDEFMHGRLGLDTGRFTVAWDDGDERTVDDVVSGETRGDEKLHAAVMKALGF